MTTFDKIRARHLESRKARDAVSSNVLGVLLSEIRKAETSGKVAKTLNEGEVLAAVNKMIKTTDETMERIAENPDRVDEYNKLEVEKKVLQGFMPEPITDEEIRDFAIRGDALGFEYGTIMMKLKENFPGRYDGKTASLIVRDVLATLRA